MMSAITETKYILLANEPINAIDEAGVKEIRDILFELRNENRIIIVACHDKEELELLADEIFEMVEGRIC